jgi:thiamine biosynthesis lipoprotein
MIIMGMPVTVELAGKGAATAIDEIFAYFHGIDARYSPYIESSELSRINKGMPIATASEEMQYVLELCERTRQETKGYFDIRKGKFIDTSGLVKGWAIQNAANQLRLLGYQDFYIEAGGDVQADGHGPDGGPWSLGIRNPFDIMTIVKTLRVSNLGVATSGTYIRGEHIYDPIHKFRNPQGVKSLTVIGPNIYEADRFATAAFAMGLKGISYIESLKGFEAYVIDNNKMATFTTGLQSYVA